MIELTTGVAFLMTSMYGVGNIPANNVNVQTLTSHSTGNTEAIVQSINKEELIKYLKKNFADTPILVEVARCESEFRQFNSNGQVVRGRANKYDVGVMQINEKYHLETAKKMGIDIYTLEGNVAFAKYLHSKYGSDPWSASAPCWSKTVAMK